MLKYFKGSAIFAAVMFAGLYALTGNVQDLWGALVLTIVEIAVSFDNAVVNAAKMERMNAFWRKMFLTVGMLIAVGLMRLYFPVQIVSIVGDIGLIEAFDVAVSDPNRFAAILTSSHNTVAGFGGAFLMMVFLKYFIDHEKKVHWIGPVEQFLSKLDNKIEAVQAVIVLSLAWIVNTHLSEAGSTFFYSAIVGVGVYIVVDAIKTALEAFDEMIARGSYAFLAGGLGTFIYLEVLDASFSFDGVIAAFAISKSIFVVTTGLAVGAMMVRSLTMMLVEEGTLTEYKFLESGAFWAIGALSAFMFIGTVQHIPEWIIACVSAVVIVISFVHSVAHNKQLASAGQPA